MNRIKISFLLLTTLLISNLATHAQNNVPQGVNYQCIIRDMDGKPVTNQNVVVNIAVFSGIQSDTLEWKEFHSTKTNNYGLVNLVIGEGTSTGQGRATNFATIPWRLGNLFVGVTVNFGKGENNLGAIKLQSVPYALVAQNALTVDYNNITNKPNYLSSESDPVYLSSTAAKIKASDTVRWSKPSSFSGNYNDLLDKPDLNGFIRNESDPVFQSSLAARITFADTTRWGKHLSGNYSDLRNKPALASVATTGNYNDLNGKPSLATVATSGNYQDLTNKPNLSGYVTAESDPLYSAGVAAKIKASDTARWSIQSGFSGDFNDLTNKPVGQNIGDMLYWNGTKWVVVPVGSNTQMLSVSNGKPAWINQSTGGGTNTTPQVVTGSMSLSTNDNDLYAYFYSSLAISSSEITSRGICWSTSPNPTTNNNKTNDGNGQGIFNPYVFGLQKNITYYARAYVITASGTYYGNEVSFIADGQIQLTIKIVNAISSTKAKCAIDIPNQGGYPLLSRGLCWNTSPSPTINNFKNGEVELISGLTPSTKYYIRAYATNSTGTYYSNEVTVTTGPSVVLLTTSGPSSFNSSSAVISGNISDDGGLTVTKRGVCWGTSTNPLATGNFKESGTGSGSFEVNITGLLPNTKYYVRSYLKNSKGTTYGNELSFTTNPAVVTFQTLSYNSNPTCNSVGINSMILDDGTNIITSLGFCWSTTAHPTTNNSKINLALTSENFYTSIASLTPNTTYYLRAFAVTPNNTFYSEEVTFKTLEASISVSTSAINNTNGTSANCSGTISVNCSSFTESGFCWATTRNPSITDHKVVSTTNSNSITATLTGLNFGNTYFVRAYATTSSGTIYGNEVYFTIGNGLITLEPGDIIDITATSATANANITDLGGISLIQKGVCWSTNANPTLKTGAFQISYGSGIGNYSTPLNNLQPNKTYYARGFAINARDTFYTTQKSFTTLSGAVSITTVAPTKVGSSTATSGGTITSYGGAEITDKGVCWSTSTNPTIANSYLSSSSNDQSFSSAITGLSGNTKYYIRAYAINAAGVWYGNELNFTTQYGKVFFESGVLTTGSSIAQIWAKITDNGGVTTTDRGVCWSTTTNPTITSSKISVGTGTDTYYPKLTGLVSNTKYYARAYAINSEGTWYGDVLSFTTKSGTDLTDIDGNKYLTVTIGGQTWMAENLRTTHYQNGDLIPNIKPQEEWRVLTIGARCYYGNDSATYAATGALYNFYVVTDNRNVCPAGWHVPSYNEWQTLTSRVTSPSDLFIGGSTGFNATLSGTRQNYGYGDFNYSGYIWTSTIPSASYAYCLVLNISYLQFYDQYPYSGMSVRCIKD